MQLVINSLIRQVLFSVKNLFYSAQEKPADTQASAELSTINQEIFKTSAMLEAEKKQVIRTEMFLCSTKVTLTIILLQYFNSQYSYLLL